MCAAHGVEKKHQLANVGRTSYDRLPLEGAVMSRIVRIGIAGDYRPEVEPHPQTDLALSHASRALGIEVAPEWIPTPELRSAAASRLALSSVDRSKPAICGRAKPAISAGVTETCEFYYVLSS